MIPIKYSNPYFSCVASLIVHLSYLLYIVIFNIKDFYRIFCFLCQSMSIFWLLFTTATGSNYYDMMKFMQVQRHRTAKPETSDRHHHNHHPQPLPFHIRIYTLNVRLLRLNRDNAKQEIFLSFSLLNSQRPMRCICFTHGSMDDYHTLKHDNEGIDFHLFK